MKAALALVLVALLGACIVTAHEPAWCSQVEQRVVGETDSTVTFEVWCAEWTAFSDSTMRWDKEGNRLP